MNGGQERYSMINWIKKLIAKIKLELAYRKKIRQLKKKDPFIY